MKKIYIKPLTKVVILDSSVSILASSPFSNEAKFSFSGIEEDGIAE